MTAETLPTQFMPNSALVRRENNFLRFGSLTDPFVVGSFMRAVHQGRQRGFEDFVLDFSDVAGVYPNACVPIAGLLDFYRSEGIEFSLSNCPESVTRTSLFAPRIVTDSLPQLSQSAMNAVWMYSTADEVSALVSAFLREVSRSAVCESGVIQGLEWCLNEVLDNVLQHAETSHGYVMGQIHHTSRHIALCIFDHGRGILNSLRDSIHAPQTDLDAITLALKEGVTRDKAVGQGNGMWGLHNIVRANSGRLGITSGNAYYRTEESKIAPTTSQKALYLSASHGCTNVDFQIDFDKPLQVATALGGYEPVNLAIEELEDNAGNIVYSLAQKSSGTGTRRSGQALRNEVLNLAKQSNKIIVLDFAGVSVVSSSFADELVGKLVAEIGFTAFTQRFRLKNMNPFVEAITNRAVTQRLSVPRGQDINGGDADGVTN